MDTRITRFLILRMYALESLYTDWDTSMVPDEGFFPYFKGFLHQEKIGIIRQF